MGDPRQTQGLTKRATAQAEALGFTEPEVLEMLKRSAPFRHPGYNRRFEGYAFRIGDVAVHEFVKLARARRGKDLLRHIDELLVHCIEAEEPHWAPDEFGEVRLAIKAELEKPDVFDRLEEDG